MGSIIYASTHPRGGGYSRARIRRNRLPLFMPPPTCGVEATVGQPFGDNSVELYLDTMATVVYHAAMSLFPNAAAQMAFLIFIAGAAGGIVLVLLKRKTNA